MGHPRTLLLAAGFAAMLAACAHGASTEERGFQGLKLSQNRKMMGLPSQSRDLLQYQPYYQRGGHNQPSYQQAGYNQPYYQRGGYNRPSYQQAGKAARYPGYRPPTYGGGYSQSRTPVGYGPTMMGRLFERITGVPAAVRPPLGDRLGNLMNGVGSVVRTVGDVLNIVSKFKD